MGENGECSHETAARNTDNAQHAPYDKEHTVGPSSLPNPMQRRCTSLALDLTGQLITSEMPCTPRQAEAHQHGQCRVIVTTRAHFTRRLTLRRLQRLKHATNTPRALRCNGRSHNASTYAGPKARQCLQW